MSFETMRKCNQVQHPQVIQKTAVNEVSGREIEREKGFLRCKSVTMVIKGYTLRFVEKSIKIRRQYALVLFDGKRNKEGKKKKKKLTHIQ